MYYILHYSNFSGFLSLARSEVLNLFCAKSPFVELVSPIYPCFFGGWGGLGTHLAVLRAIPSSQFRGLGDNREYLGVEFR